ncbi:MAG: adenylosuccinate lyase [Armatimonadota bacterium]
MIERYSYPEMTAIWEAQSRYDTWLEVELQIAEAWAELGVVPKEAAIALRKNAKVDAKRAIELEGESPGKESEGKDKKRTRHDLIAFLHAVYEHLGEEKNWLHYGVTSYDIEDTALSLLMKKAADLLLKDMDQLEAAIIERANEHKWTYMMGRSHGVHAEPITFGLKLCVWLAELRRRRVMFEHAIETISACKISGAVGTFANVDPRVEEIAAKNLGLTPSPAATQVLQRDRHAEFLAALALLGGALEQFATEMRNLQRTDILEVEESFQAGQRGSSAMPHKRNPIVCERVSGMARLMRSYLVPAIENMALWHERDIAHSSVERVIIPDACILMDYMLKKFTVVVKGMHVYEKRMLKNLNATGGLFNSEAVMLAAVKNGMGKDEAYTTVQKHAMNTWEMIQNDEMSAEELGTYYPAQLKADPDLQQYLTPEEIDHAFDWRRHLKNIEVFYQRLGI